MIAFSDFNRVAEAKNKLALPYCMTICICVGFNLAFIINIAVITPIRKKCTRKKRFVIFKRR